MNQALLITVFVILDSRLILHFICKISGEIVKVGEIMSGSENGINHKCPCCGYEVEYDWCKPNGEELVKGDESFIRILNSYGDTTDFETDKPRYVSWGLPDTEKVMLLGCPKCHTVSFQFD